MKYLFKQKLEQCGWKKYSNKSISDQTVVLEDILENFLQQNLQYPHHKVKIEIQKIINDIENNQSDIGINQLILTKILNNNRKSKEKPWINFEDIEANQFHYVENFVFNYDNVVHEIDFLLFINGLPIIIIKINPDKDTTFDEFFYKLNKKHEKLFAFNIFTVFGSEKEVIYGDLDNHKNHWKPWKINDINQSKPILNSENIETKINFFITGLLKHKTLLNVIDNFVIFRKNKKVIAMYQQYYATLKIIKSLETSDQKIGVLWHTQGSGKTFVMVFLANLIRKHNKYHLIFITDRTNLNNQLYEKFNQIDLFNDSCNKIKEMWKTKLQLMKTTKNLFFFSTIQKFNETTNDPLISPISEKENILIVADEAHRSQYGLEISSRIDMEKDNAKHHFGWAKYLRDCFPKAKFLGFTATPIKNSEKSTEEIFGEVIDRYDLQQSVEDKTTVPIIQEQINIPFPKIPDENALFEKYIEEKRQYRPEKTELKKNAINMSEALLSEDTRITNFVKIVWDHYQKLLQNKKLPKAMIVADSRFCAVKIYQKIIEFQPEFKDKIHLIISQDNNDTEEFKKIISHSKEKEKIDEFKNNPNIKIVIVVTKLLTGFDLPELKVMYVDTVIKQHNLLQAMARVNRKYVGKKSGLFVYTQNDTAKEIELAKKNYEKYANTKVMIFNVKQLEGKMQELIKELNDKFVLKFLKSLYEDQGKIGKEWRKLFALLPIKEQKKAWKSFYKQQLGTDFKTKTNYEKALEIIIPIINELEMIYDHIPHKGDITSRKQAKKNLRSFNVILKAKFWSAFKKLTNADNNRLNTDNNDLIPKSQDLEVIEQPKTSNSSRENNLPSNSQKNDLSKESLREKLLKNLENSNLSDDSQKDELSKNLQNSDLPNDSEKDDSLNNLQNNNLSNDFSENNSQNDSIENNPQDDVAENNSSNDFQIEDSENDSQVINQNDNFDPKKIASEIAEILMEKSNNQLEQYWILRSRIKFYLSCVAKEQRQKADQFNDQLIEIHTTLLNKRNIDFDNELETAIKQNLDLLKQIHDFLLETANNSTNRKNNKFLNNLITFIKKFTSK